MSGAGNRPVWPWLLLGAVALGVLIAYLSVEFPEALSSEDNRMQLVVGALWLALIGGSFLARASRGGLRLLFGSLAIWMFIGLGLLTAYSFRHEFARLGERVMGELMPHRPTPEAQRPGAAAPDPGVSFRARQGGHFVVEARVNGEPIRFLVDTGASDVVLSPADARRVGINPNALSYTRRYNTANGVVEGAPITLNRVNIGGIELEDVRASVNRAEMPGSLLGMSFLGRLGGYEVRDGVLTLRP